MYTKPTLATLKQSLADRHDSGTLPTDSATLSLWTRLLNRGVNYCINKLRITQKTSVTTSSGTIALPTDFILVNKVIDSANSELEQIALDDAENAVVGQFWISGSFTGGFYLNTKEDRVYDVYYTFHASPMVNDSDTCAFDDEEAVVAYAYGMLRKSESDPFEDSASSLAECDSRLRELQDVYQINSEPLGFKILKNA